MGEYTVRALDENCLDQLMEIENASFTLPWSRESYHNDITNNDMATYIGVFDGDRLLGYGGFWHIADEAHINNIAVHPACRRGGVGMVVMQTLINLAIVKGCVAMTLEVRVSNAPAQALYEKLGFRTMGVRPKYYHDNDEDAAIMWLFFDENR